jgi:SAM-dependent methyltransferase
MEEPEPQRVESPVLYAELASWWPLMSAPADYAGPAAYYDTALRAHCVVTPQTLLELGSGGGNNASHLKRRFEQLTLVDISPGMLDVSRALNPECEHHVGDMRDVRLNQEFDCVFVHDAVCYATTADDLRQVIETAYVHCRPGGAALFAPDFVCENFRSTTDHGGRDGEQRSLRYLGWTWDPDPDDTMYFADYAYLLREGDGTVLVRYDRHVQGLFSTAYWIGALEAAGFLPQVLTYHHSDLPYESVSFVGTRPKRP